MGLEPQIGIFQANYLARKLHEFAWKPMGEQCLGGTYPQQDKQPQQYLEDGA